MGGQRLLIEQGSGPAVHGARAASTDWIANGSVDRPNTGSRLDKGPENASPASIRPSSAARGHVSRSVIFRALSKAGATETRPPVRSETSRAKLWRCSIPEMLFCGYSVVIRQMTGCASGCDSCALAGAADSARPAAITSTATLWIDHLGSVLRINLAGEGSCADLLTYMYPISRPHSPVVVNAKAWAALAYLLDVAPPSRKALALAEQCCLMRR